VSENAEQRRYWPWWWQIKELIALMIGVGVVSVEAYRGTYNLAAMGLVAACIGVVAMTEYAKSVYRRNENGGGR
jgi:hypothetical protein